MTAVKGIANGADARLKKAKHHEIAIRYRNGKEKNTGLMAALRHAQLSGFFSDKYGETLPPDDAGRDDAWIMANIIARTKGGEREIRRWLALRTPWMAGKDVDQIAADAMRLRLKWTADKLAHCIGLTFEVRDRLGITTIGACDMTKAEREAVRKARMRKAKADKRRADGLKPRAEYEASAVGHGKPWLAEGLSRATWYRRQRTAK
jgi:hypothetical protein